MSGLIQTQARPARVQARLAAGQSQRRLKSWRPPLEHINEAIRNGGELLLRRCREMEHSNAYAARAARAWAGYAVRDGIRPTFQGAAALQRRVRTAWSEFVECCDFDGCDTLWGIQELVAREVYVGGEAFVVRMDGTTDLDLSLRVFQSEQLPTGSTMVQASETGNRVRDGIEFDDRGRRVAYHFYEGHPGDLKTEDGVVKGMTRRMPAEDVIHVYPRQNAGQIRGLSRLAAGMIRLHLLDAYDDAELDRQRIAALFAGFITRPQDGEGPLDGVAPASSGAEATDDVSADEEAVVVDLAPGLLQELEPGEEITFSNPPQIQGQYEAFEYRNLLAVSAAFGVPYHVLTGDVEKANYSSARVAQLDFKVEIGRFQQRCLVDQFCRGIRRWFLQSAGVVGSVRTRDVVAPWTWNLPRWDWVDPKAEAEAAEAEVNNGFTSRRRVVESRGHALEEIDAEIAADQFTPADQRKETPDAQDPT